jgi:hypothetical protein
LGFHPRSSFATPTSPDLAQGQPIVDLAPFAALLTFAFERAVERTRRRVTDRPLTGDAAADIASALRELLPLDEARRIDATVTLAFASLAATTPELQRIQADLLTTIRGELVERLGPRSETRATVLLAAVDGLALHEISAPGTLTPSDITAALELAIDAALWPEQG